MSTSFPSSAQTPRAFPLPTIAEDTLHYTLHSSASSATETDALAVLITEYVESLLIQPWSWNKDGWELKRVEGRNGQSEGRMRVGDAVDDEWAVVWLLKQVSQKWKDLVISIRDSDGEFSLIEAANESPPWVSPENAENRLWSQDGHLHLIPLSVRSSTTGLPRPIPDEEEDERRFDAETYSNEEDGVSAVRTGKYRAEDKMEQAVWDRISSYPDALKTHQHRTKAWSPERIARALSQKPELIQKAVEGFYVRDPVQSRAASRMTHFPPSPAVLSSVSMTRAAYAQLQGQVFHPPRVFGPEWHIREGQNSDDERRWRDLGVKIATGFEIMYREGGARGRSGQKDAAAEDIRSSAEYQTFISNLKRAGFFGTELEGSEKWKQREEEALKGWRQVRSADTSAQRPSFAYQVDQAIQASSTTDQGSLQVSPNDPEDSDKWLEVSPDELDGMMQKASGASASAVPGERAEVGDEHGRALGDLAKKVEEFIGGQGDVEGARFVDELSDEDMDDDSDEEEQQGMTAAEKDERMKNLVAPLPENEWGRKTQQTVVPAAKGESKKGNVNEHSGMKMRPPRFAKQQFDGVESDSDDDVDEADSPPVGTIGRQIAQMKWGDMGPKIEEIDDEEEEENRAARSRKFDMGDDIDEQMRRKVWGGDDGMEQGDEAPMVVNDGDDMDVDMGLEGEEFLKFSKEASGINEDMWRDIVASREARGAFVPESSKNVPVEMPSQGGSKSAQHLPSGSSTSQQEPTAQPATAEQSGVNMDLDSFDKVMAAMDAESAKIKGPQQAAQPTSSGLKSKAPAQVKFASLPDSPSEADSDDSDDEDLAAMDRESKAALKNAGVEDVSDDEIPEADESDEDGKREYKMMKDFSESYRSQGGQSGVVGNLFGRLGEEKKK